MDRRRAVMVVRFGGRAHRPTCPRGTGEMTCSTGSFVSLAQSLDEVAAQPAAALARERRDDDLVDALVVDDLYGRRVRIRMDDLAVRVYPLAPQHARGRAEDGGRRPRGPRRRSAGRRSESSPGSARPACGCGRATRPRRRSGLRSRACSPRLRRARPRRRRAAQGDRAPRARSPRRRSAASTRSAPRRGSRRRSRPLSARAAPARPSPPGPARSRRRSPAR